MDLVPPDLTDLTRQHFLEFTEPSGSGMRVKLCGGVSRHLSMFDWLLSICRISILGD